MNSLKKYGLCIFAILISLVFFIVPFFWYPRGFIDLTGDSYRGYFLDPISFIRNFALYGISPSGIGSIDPYYYTIPYVSIIALLTWIFQDPWTVIAITNGTRLALTFISFYLLVRMLIERQGLASKNLKAYISLIGALLYVSLTSSYGWGASLFSFNHIFVYPFIAYLLLVYLINKDKLAAFSLLLLSLLFSLNFNLTSAPQFFSFFPFVLIFTLYYVRYVLHLPINWMSLWKGLCLFCGIHAFHLLPQLATLLSQDSYINEHVFTNTNTQNSGASYFLANKDQFGHITANIFQLGSRSFQNVFAFIVPVVMIVGFIKKRSKLLALLGVFLLITLFLVSANITALGPLLYEKLFYIPGYLMFRSFWEKWYFVFAFFYALTATISLYHILSHTRAKTYIALGLCIIFLLLFRLIPFLKGETIRATHLDSKSVRADFAMDPDLQSALQFVSRLPSDGRVLTLPLTFPAYQIAYGTNKGAYVGISLIATLAGKQDFPGFWSFGPYEERINKYIMQNDMSSIVRTLSLLNIRYIFRNTDSRVIDNFPGYPYKSKTELPMLQNQASYDTFLQKLPVSLVYKKGFYEVYEIEDSHIRPFMYVPDEILQYEASGVESSSRSAVVATPACGSLTCGKYNVSTPKITHKKISPIHYTFTITLPKDKSPFLLVVSSAYHDLWNIHINNRDVRVGSHLKVNQYANGWIIYPSNADNTDVVTGYVYLTFQMYFYVGCAISVGTLVLLFFLAHKYNARKPFGFGKFFVKLGK